MYMTKLCLRRILSLQCDYIHKYFSVDSGSSSEGHIMVTPLSTLFYPLGGTTVNVT